MAKLRDWFLELDEELWDQQIASDFQAGKFDKLIAKARAEVEVEILKIHPEFRALLNRLSQEEATISLDDLREELSS